MAIVLGSVLASLKEAIDMHSLNVALYDWAMIIEVAISAGATYLFANLFKNSDGVLGGRERR